MNDDKINREEEYLLLRREIEKLESMILPHMQNRLTDNVIIGLSHDINNRLLKISYVLNEIKEKFSHRIEYKIYNSLKSLEVEISSIGFLLESLRIKKNYKKEFIDLESFIDFIISSMKISKKTILFKLLNNNMPKLLINKSKMFLVVYELIKNSIDAITIRKKNKETGLIKVKLDLVDKYFKISFEDNGVGIPSEVLEKITNLGFTTKDEGSGLGLSFIKDFIENEMNGELEIESKLNKGTLIMIKIPKYMNYVD